MRRGVHLPAAAALAPSAAIAADTGALLGPLAQSLAGLAVVLAVVLAAGWVLRRLQPGAGGANGPARSIGALAVGPKERVVVVEVGETWLVLGVAPGSVNALASLPKSEQRPAAASPAAPRFADLLARLRG